MCALVSWQLKIYDIILTTRILTRCNRSHDTLYSFQFIQVYVQLGESDNSIYFHRLVYLTDGNCIRAIVFYTQLQQVGTTSMEYGSTKYMYLV